MLEQLIFTDEAAIAGVRCRSLPSTPSALRSCGSARRSRRRSSCPGSRPGSCTSLSATPSRKPAPTSPRCARRAVRDGDEYVITGQKMWTSLIQYADYVWLACRTDPDALRHKGLSIILVPTDAAGFSWTPVTPWPGMTTSATYYDDIRVPAPHLVGDENKGWPLITNQLNHERVALTSAAPVLAALADVTEWARPPSSPTGGGSSTQDGPSSISPGCNQGGAPQADELADRRQAGATLGPADASATKVYGTEPADRGLPAADGGARPERRCARARPARCCPARRRITVRADPDLRRRHQRGAARHHRRRRRSDCPLQPQVSEGETAGMDSTLTQAQQDLGSARPEDPH